MNDHEVPEWIDELRASARSTRWQAGAARWQVAREAAAVQYLSDALGLSRFLPPIGGWSVDYTVVAAVLDAVRLRDVPVNILELGSGAGTPWFATIAQQSGGHLVSVEHDPTHVARTADLVDYYGLGNACTVVEARLTGTHQSDAWYDLDAILESLGGNLVDVLVVDGPPSGVGPQARRPALFRLEQCLADNALVVLDDVVRDDEQQTLSDWRDAFGDRMSTLPILDRAAMFFLRAASDSPQQEDGRLDAPVSDQDEELPGGRSGAL